MTNEKIPLGCIACMMVWWKPPNTCKYEKRYKFECDWRKYCEKLSSLINWEEGFRPRAKTRREFLCKNCRLIKEINYLKKVIESLKQKYYKEYQITLDVLEDVSKQKLGNELYMDFLIEFYQAAIKKLKAAR